MPPNYFIGIRLNCPIFHKLIDNIQNCVLVKAPTLKGCKVPSNKAHLTCFVLTLKSAEEINKAVQCFTECQHDIEIIFSDKSFPAVGNRELVFDQVERFGHRVLFAAPREDEVMAALRHLTHLFELRFASHGLLKPEISHALSPIADSAAADEGLKAKGNTGEWAAYDLPPTSLSPMPTLPPQPTPLTMDSEARSLQVIEGKSGSNYNGISDINSSSIEKRGDIRKEMPRRQRLKKQQQQKGAKKKWVPHLTLFKTSADRRNGRKLRIEEEHCEGCEAMLLRSDTSTGGFEASSIDQATGPSKSGFEASSIDQATGPSKSGFEASSIDQATGPSKSGFEASSIDQATGPFKGEFEASSIDQRTGSSKSKSIAAGVGQVYSVVPNNELFEWQSAPTGAARADGAPRVQLTTIDLLSMMEKDSDGYYKSYAQLRI